MKQFLILAFAGVASFITNVEAQCRCAPVPFCQTQWKAVVNVVDASKDAVNPRKLNIKYEVIKQISPENIPSLGLFETPLSLAACGIKVESGKQYLMGGLVEGDADGDIVMPKKLITFCHTYAKETSSIDVLNDTAMTLNALCPQ